MVDLVIPDLDKQYGSTKDVAELYIGENQKGEDIIFYVGKSGSPEHEKIAQSYAQALERVRNRPKKRQRIMAEIIAKAVLKGWKGLLDQQGNPIPCNFDNKMNVLMNKNYGKRIVVDILEAANDIGNFQEDDLDEDEDDDVPMEELNMTPEEVTEKNSEIS
jgi:hypothetical protein